MAMADALLQLFYFVRPLMFAYVDVRFFGLGFFEILTILMVGVLFCAFLLSSRDSRRGLDRLDIAMICFVVWCAFVTVVQWDDSDLKASIKWMLPFVMYLLLRRMVRTEKDFLRYLRNLVLGFAIIVAVNAAAILQGKGLYSINYYTGFERYQGVFKDLHSMAHTIGFSIMLVVIYFGLQRAWRGPGAWRKQNLLMAVSALIVALAVFSLIKSNVRTVMIGLVVFFGVLVWLRNRRWFAVYAGGLVAVWLLSGYVQTVFWDATRGKGVGSAVEMAGSGRPFIWGHNLRMYMDLPFDQQITGLGVGNEIGVMPANGVITSEYRFRAWESHNDYLSALMELGIVGFALVVWIYYLLFQHARSAPVPVRPYYLALLVAVIAMNFLSNSYLNRFGLGQLFVMVMVGLDVARHGHQSQAVGATFLAGFSRVGRPRLP
jgi:O-antigen ligase